MHTGMAIGGPRAGKMISSHSDRWYYRAPSDPLPHEPHDPRLAAAMDASTSLINPDVEYYHTMLGDAEVWILVGMTPDQAIMELLDNYGPSYA